MMMTTLACLLFFFLLVAPGSATYWQDVTKQYTLEDQKPVVATWPKLSMPPASSIVEGPAGTPWFMTASGIFAWDAATNTTSAVVGALPHGTSATACKAVAIGASGMHRMALACPTSVQWLTCSSATQCTAAATATPVAFGGTAVLAACAGKAAFVGAATGLYKLEWSDQPAVRVV